ncbi:hypothetical protein AWM70_15905 [Paenibacillus yonginensis]|uniref:Uncharacterized protein n=1 Tax=Paenibacillus yonginensis TaxID=1462996 RepID=A0A1B1N392_9BACL|nr:hypothetical protein [Paenibacillus yonginensis]ANS75890.1 hypothetical protein AWM70_15905 [Paenibacillus yonginensis]
MSAFEEYEQERREIDNLLFKGYRIQDLQENLDGAVVTFIWETGGSAAAVSADSPPVSPTAARIDLVLLTADARKYVMTRYIELKRERAG